MPRQRGCSSGWSEPRAGDPLAEGDTVCRSSCHDLTDHVTGKKLGWFFDIYIRQPKLPVLSYQASGNTLNLQWKTPNDLPLPMPVDVVVNGVSKRVEMPNGKGSIALPQDAKFTVDPNGCVLKEL